jgi:uroporphyrin-III C-methyltransferase
MNAADLVLYDALVDPRVLDLAPTAQRFFVGKRAGRPAIAQSTIHSIMIRAARRGRVVVRLKAGDPFVLGRGGEEALACEAAGVPCEIIPGISSAIAGPAAFGIPLTHRGVSPGFVVLSATPAAHYEAVLSRLGPDAVTVVLMMALAARPSIARFLLREGWPEGVPAAVILGATTSRAWSWRGTLGSLEHAVIPRDRCDLPGLLVLGHVVSLADTVSRAMNAAESGVAGGPEEEEDVWRREQVR